MKTQLITLNSKPNKSKFRTIKNMMMWCKPEGGMWSSTYLGEEYGSDWIQWCLTESDFRRNKYFTFSPKKTARIYEIDKLKDLIDLFPVFQDKKPNEFPHVYYRSLDFEKLSKVYDAIHLTSNGEPEEKD